MTDVVLRLPVEIGEEAKLFGQYLNHFMESRTAEATRLASCCDAPYLILHSDPCADRELKVVTFQERGAAQAFHAGWLAARGGLNRETA